MENTKLGQMKTSITPVKNTAIATYDDNKFVEIGQAFTQGITLPTNYDVQASMKSLYLMCVSSPQGNLIEKCTPTSIEQSIRQVLLEGLQPHKKQCYPVPMGDKLTILRSYQGAKRVAYNNGDVVRGSIRSQVIYKNDKFVDRLLNDARRIIVKHEQAPFGERSDEIIGAYATFQKRVGDRIVFDMELMTIKEIQASWAMSRTSGTVHKQFPHEMCCKTVEARACKKLYSWTDENVRVYEATGSVDVANEYGFVDNEVWTDNSQPQDIDITEYVENEEIVQDVEITEAIGEAVNEEDIQELQEEIGEIIIVDSKTYQDNKDKYERVYKEDSENGYNDKGYNAIEKKLFVTVKNA